MGEQETVTVLRRCSAGISI